MRADCEPIVRDGLCLVSSRPLSSDVSITRTKRSTCRYHAWFGGLQLQGMITRALLLRRDGTSAGNSYLESGDEFEFAKKLTHTEILQRLQEGKVVKNLATLIHDAC